MKEQKELERIYEQWTQVQSDSSEVIHKWCEIEKFLYVNCEDECRESIEDYVMDYGKMLEKQSFIAGFVQAFQIWMEIYNSDQI
ncbi:MAG: hypothetical protein Q4C50_03890 [Eubacteriales bacterium]|nr:hypothetical protein [Eubacteriales bacterium]